MSPSEEAEAKPENCTRIPHLKEDKKRQKQEWLKRRKEEKIKQKREWKEARGMQGVPCVSEPVTVHEVILPQGEEIVIDNKKKKNDFTECDAGTDLSLLQGSRIQRDEKQDEASSIACKGAQTIPPTSQATRKANGKRRHSQPDCHTVKIEKAKARGFQPQSSSFYQTQCSRRECCSD